MTRKTIPNSGQWWDEIWNLTVGCSPCSPGCDRCYAAAIVRRFGPTWAKAQAKPRTADGRHRDEGVPAPGGRPMEDPLVRAYRVAVNPETGHWSGRVSLLEHKLRDALWVRPGRTVFVCGLSDLFHKSVPAFWIERIWQVMRLRPDVQFVVLTKRGRRMASILSSLEPGDPLHGLDAWLDEEDWVRAGQLHPDGSWPLSNVAVGVSSVGGGIRNSPREHEHEPVVRSLANTPAACRFVSYEPLLRHPGEIVASFDWMDGAIVGGETGPGSRPVEEEWFKWIRDICAQFGKTFFLKHWGSAAKRRGIENRMLDGRTWDELPWDGRVNVEARRSCGGGV